MNNNTRSFTKLTEKKGMNKFWVLKVTEKLFRQMKFSQKPGKLFMEKCLPSKELLICEDTKIRERLPALKGRKTDTLKTLEIPIKSVVRQRI